MYLTTLFGSVEKRYLLDILAYFLWDDNAPYELSAGHVLFGKKLYKEILKEMKKEAQCYNRNNAGFGYMELECQELSTVYFLEKRLERIEQLFADRVAKGLTDSI